MRLSFPRFLLLMVLPLALLASCGRPAHAGPLGDLFRGVDFRDLLVPFVIVTLVLSGRTLHLAAAYLRQKTKAIKTAQLLDTLGSQADGIAEMVRSHPPAPDNVLTAVRQAAISQSVRYAREVYGDVTLPLLGMTDAQIATRLDKEVAGRLLASPPAVVTALAA